MQVTQVVVTPSRVMVPDATGQQSSGAGMEQPTGAVAAGSHSLWRERRTCKSSAVPAPVASVVLPAHNEQDRLDGTLREYGRALHQRYGGAFELIVACNGCTDRTVEVALALARALPRIRVLETPAAVGKGGAVLEGMRRAAGGRVAFADADGATSCVSLIALLDALDAADVAIGSRRHPGSVIGSRQPPLRRALGYAFGVTVRLLFGMPYRDTQCGAKAFRQTAVRQLAPLVAERRWTFDVDLLLAAAALRLRVSEHPVVWTDRPGSRLRVVPTVGDVVPALWRLKRRHAGRSALQLVPASTAGDLDLPSVSAAMASGA